MLCEICVWMLRGRRGQIFGGTLGLHFVHHDSAESFWTSVSRDCSICRVLGDELGTSFFPALQGTRLTRDRAFLNLRSQAHLSVVYPATDDTALNTYIYRLDFTVEWAGIKFSRTFVLRPTNLIELQLRTPVSDHMYHAEVLGLAKTWLKKCTCVEKTSTLPLERDRFPTRLIDLSELKKLGTIDLDEWKYHGTPALTELLDTPVKLVETASMDRSRLEGKTYVTLSHKWGGTDKPVRLTKETQETYREGVKLGSLPKTFQDAIRFALRVDEDDSDHNVHFIWIDSLCIIQGDPDDWLKESALMQKVYRNSFLNISATAAENSNDGLYSERYPQHLWEDVVGVDIHGLHKDMQQGTRLPLRTLSDSPANSSTMISEQPDTDFTYLAKVRSCLLLDVSNWETLVNQAPVNKRGWVVQERLLAPRVLHFCRGRIAWECAEFDEIEGHYPNIPNYQLAGDEIYEGVPIKGLEPGKHGQKLRKNRLRGQDDPLLGTKDDSPVVHSLELWARIVEMYSRTDLTHKKDKLIALSGIAHRMATIIGESQYVAGLWDRREHLVSQLLWHVEPVCRAESEAGGSILEYPSRRPTEYRAPSFSWASVDAQYGKGITCGDIINREEVLVNVPPDDADPESGEPADVWGRSVFVQWETENKFGLVSGGHIRLEAIWLPVKLRREGTHYYWFLEVCDGVGDGVGEDVSKEKHFNVCLDCPGDDDRDGQLTKPDNDKICCMPVALRSSRKSTDLICLLLERVPQNPQIKTWPDFNRQCTFRRIGFSKLSLTFDHLTLMHIAESFERSSGSGSGTYPGKQIVYII